MGWFGNEKKFKSNNKLFEIVCGNTIQIEEQVEERYLYRNIESVEYSGSSGTAMIKYKDLKVRSEMEVKMIGEQLFKEAGLYVGLGR